MSLSRTISEINDDFSRKSPTFPIPVYLTPPLKELPLELGKAIRQFAPNARGQKLEWWSKQFYVW